MKELLIRFWELCIGYCDIYEYPCFSLHCKSAVRVVYFVPFTKRRISIYDYRYMGYLFRITYTIPYSWEQYNKSPVKSASPELRDGISSNGRYREEVEYATHHISKQLQVKTWHTFQMTVLWLFRVNLRSDYQIVKEGGLFVINTHHRLLKFRETAGWFDGQLSLKFSTFADAYSTLVLLDLKARNLANQ